MKILSLFMVRDLCIILFVSIILLFISFLSWILTEEILNDDAGEILTLIQILALFHIHPHEMQALYRSIRSPWSKPYWFLLVSLLQKMALPRDEPSCFFDFNGHDSVSPLIPLYILIYVYISNHWCIGIDVTTYEMAQWCIYILHVVTHWYFRRPYI